MKENKAENLILIGFTIIGALFVIIGIIMFGTVFNYKNKVNTIGTIAKISSYMDNNQEKNINQK